MKKFLISILLLVVSFSGYSQEFIDDSNFEDKINTKNAFGDDEFNFVVVEFWAKFNEANAFADWDKVKGVTYYRIDVASAPLMKKKFRIRMAPTLIIFNKGIKEETFKAGLDLECPVTLEELEEALEELKIGDKF